MKSFSRREAEFMALMQRTPSPVISREHRSRRWRLLSGRIRRGLYPGRHPSLWYHRNHAAPGYPVSSGFLLSRYLWNRSSRKIVTSNQIQVARRLQSISTIVSLPATLAILFPRALALVALTNEAPAFPMSCWSRRTKYLQLASMADILQVE
jgi:hypothetical protein